MSGKPMETKHSYLLPRWLKLQGVEVVERSKLSLVALFILISLGVGSRRSLCEFGFVIGWPCRHSYPSNHYLIWKSPQLNTVVNLQWRC